MSKRKHCIENRRRGKSEENYTAAVERVAEIAAYQLTDAVGHKAERCDRAELGFKKPLCGGCFGDRDREIHPCQIACKINRHAKHAYERLRR